MGVKKNVFFMLGDKVLKLVFGFGISALLARYLGPNNYGELSLYLTILSFLQVVSVFGIDEIVTRDLLLSKTEEEVNEILFTVIIFRFILFIIILLGSIIYFYIFNIEVKNYIYFIFLLDIFFNAFIVLQLFFRAKEENIEEVKASQKSYFMRVILRLYYLLSKGSLLLFSFIFISEKFLFVCFLYIQIKKKIKLKFKYSKKYLKKIYKEGRLIMISNLILLMYMRMDQIMIGQILGMKKLGIYSVGVKFAELYNFIPGIIILAFMPKIIQEKKEKKYKNKILMLSRLNVIISILYASFITLIGSILILTLYGKEYLSVIPILKLYSWSGIVTVIGMTFNKFLILEKKQHLYLYSVVVGTVFNICLNFIFIKRYGILGAALVTVGSQIISNFVFFLFVKDKEQIICRISSLKVFKFKYKELAK